MNTTALLQQAHDLLLPVYGETSNICTNIRAHLAAQPAPAEPVAWMEPCGTLMYVSEVPNPERPTETAVPLYTHTAAPVPVPLTNLQISCLWSWSATLEAEQTASTQPHAFARAIEAHHGIAASPGEAMTNKYKFWMVFAEGGGHPNRQHWSKAGAELEAIRLAQKNGKPVYVLESVSGYEVPPPTVSKFNTDEVAPSEQEKPQ